MAIKEIWVTSDGKQFGGDYGNDMANWHAKMNAQNHEADQARLSATLTQLSAQDIAETNAAYEQMHSLNVKAEELINNKDYDGAIAALNRAISISSRAIGRLGTSHFLLGRAYYAKENYDKALENLNIADFSLMPEALDQSLISVNRYYAPAVYYVRGGVYFQMKDNNKAITDFKKAADWDWYDQAVQKEAGLQKENDRTKALKALKRLGVEYTPQMPQIPKDWESFRPKASSFAQISTADVEIETSDVSAKKREIANRYLQDGIRLYKVDEFERAVYNLTKAIEIGTDDLVTTYFYRACANISLNMKQAIDDYKKAADLGDTESLGWLEKLGVKYTPGSSSVPKKKGLFGGLFGKK